MARSIAEPLRGVISIHAPRTGSDAGLVPIFSSAEISIHAPRTGSDGNGGITIVFLL